MYFDICKFTTICNVYNVYRWYIILLGSVGFRKRILQGDRFPTLLAKCKRSAIIVQILTSKYQIPYVSYIFI